MRSRSRFSTEDRPPAPFGIPERSWAIHAAFCREGRSAEDIGRSYRLSPAQVRRIVDEVEARIGRASGRETASVGLESPVESLGLSVRARNALRGIGCHTVDDALELDLSISRRGFGRKTRDELLAALEQAGFRHRALDEPGADVRILERSLERIEGRIDAALGAVAREIRLMKQRLRKRKAPRNGSPSGAAPGAPPAGGYCGGEN